MTKYDRTDVGEDGTFYIRFIKDDGGYHRTSIPLDIDPDKQMEFVNKHLEQLGQTRVPAIECNRIREDHGKEKSRRENPKAPSKGQSSK